MIWYHARNIYDMEGMMKIILCNVCKTENIFMYI